MAKSKTKSRREAKKRARERSGRGSRSLVGRCADGTVKPRTGVVSNSGSGFHSSDRYGKRERRQGKQRIDGEV